MPEANPSRGKCGIGLPLATPPSILGLTWAHVGLLWGRSPGVISDSSELIWSSSGAIFGLTWAHVGLLWGQLRLIWAHLELTNAHLGPQSPAMGPQSGPSDVNNSQSGPKVLQVL